MSYGENRAKVCALINALQHEPMSEEQLAEASGMHINAVREWRKAFHEAQLVGPAGFAPRRFESGTPASLWAWRFA